MLYVIHAGAMVHMAPTPWRNTRRHFENYTEWALAGEYGCQLRSVSNSLLMHSQTWPGSLGSCSRLWMPASAAAQHTQLTHVHPFPLLQSP